jgi:hypothetical protein
MPGRHHIASHGKLSSAPNAVSTSIPSETVVLDPVSDKYFSLEGVGPRIWELLQQTTTLAQIVETILSEYEVDEATCERDVRALVEELVESGLVLHEPVE